MRRLVSYLAALHTAHKLGKIDSNSLIVLPATDRAIKLVHLLARSRDVWVLKCALFDHVDESSPLGRSLKTPAEIIRISSGRPELSRPVISFPEMIVGDGPSFTKVPFLDQERYFSTMEVLIIARHAPRVLGVLSYWGHAGYRHIDMSIRTVPAERSVEGILVELLKPIEDEIVSGPRDWRGALSLASKTQSGFNACVREDCRDLEALLRTLLLLNGGRQARAERMLQSVRSVLESCEAVQRA